MTNKEKLFQYLRTQKLLTLAVNDKKLWICSLYYYMDEDFNFYVFTSPKTKHAKMFTKNKNVACNIFDSHQKITKDKVGAQVEGVVSMVSAVDKLKWALKMWNNANPGIADKINFLNMRKKIISGKVYKIKPTRIQFFNQEIYGDEETEMFKFN